jgi:hypothetical protein
MYVVLIPKIHQMTIAFLGNNQLCSLAIWERYRHHSGGHHCSNRSQNILCSTTGGAVAIHCRGRSVGSRQPAL